MTTLSHQQCEACRADAPRITEEELKELVGQLPDWSTQVRDRILQLERTFIFRNFAEALELTNQLCELAEQENHYPAILTEWCKVTVTWWSHKIRGLHRNDFIHAVRTDQLFTAS